MSNKRNKFKIRTPLAVKGGIRAQTFSGPFRIWWARRWIAALESFHLGARLGRGRSYATGGQVSELKLEPGRASATVQGAAPKPYTCEIRFRVPEGAVREHLIAAIRREPIWLARLLVGDLPAEIETLFTEAQLPFFPRKENDVVSHCSCPDWANPCKHLAAVYCLIGEAAARDPLILLNLRGISRADLIGPAEPAAPMPPAAPTPPAESVYGATLPAFTDFGPAPQGSAETSAPLLHRLGAIPFWRGQERFADTLEHLYSRAAARGWQVWSGETIDLRKADERVVIHGADLRLKESLRMDPSAR